MPEYVGSIEKVNRAIEKMSGDPLHQYLDLKKDKEILVNNLMKLLWNRVPALCRGPGLYCEELSRKYTPNEIYRIAINFCKAKISKEMAGELFKKMYNEFERVITNEMDYTCCYTTKPRGRKIKRYRIYKKPRKGPHKKRNRLSRILKRK